MIVWSAIYFSRYKTKKLFSIFHHSICTGIIYHKASKLNANFLQLLIFCKVLTVFLSHIFIFFFCLGNEFVSQDGSLPGYQTLATYIPDKRTGIYVAMLGDEKPKNFVAKVSYNTRNDIILVVVVFYSSSNIRSNCNYHYNL